MAENSNVTEILTKYLFGLRFIKLKSLCKGMNETFEN